MTTEEEVKEALDIVRPGLMADGGDIELVGVEDDVVKVRLTGACAGCPMSQMTLKNFVEQHLRERVPGIKGVESV